MPGIRHLLLVTLLLLGLTTLRPAHPLVAQDCTDAAEIIETAMTPDADVLAPATDFTVTWTLQNVGTCTWSRTYRFIFINGDRMDGARTTRLRESVAPGATVTLALELTAPDEVDSYRGTWRLRNADGSTFGPDLTIAIDVDNSTTSAGNTANTTDVVLPEVLAFGGLGGAGDAEAIHFCLEYGAWPDVPTLLYDYDALQYHYTTLYICGYPIGTEITVEITDPLGNVFSRDYIEDEPLTVEDDFGNEYTNTVINVPLGWINASPRGAWLIEVWSEAYNDSLWIEVLPVTNDEYDFPVLDNWPLTPTDPFLAADTCHYGYLPGEMMVLAGYLLPANAQLNIGVYQDRLSYGYLIDQLTVETDANGQFFIEYPAWPEAGVYTLSIFDEINPEGISEDGAEYDLSYAGQTAWGCAQVILEEALLGQEPENPLRLLFQKDGDFGITGLEVMHPPTGEGLIVASAGGGCSAGHGAWWPDGEWVVFHSNCEQVLGEDGWMVLEATPDFDLFANVVDYTYELPLEETLIQLTDTPDLHELDPHASIDSLIVYSQLPPDAIQGSSGELRVLDPFEEWDISLGLDGRAPIWSPDGTRIAFMSDVEGAWQIYAFDINTEELWLVSRGCTTHCRQPAWSPDGRQILYHQTASLQDFTASGLWLAAAKGIMRPRLLLPGEYSNPTWSDTGWIAFEGVDGIYRVSDEIVTDATLSPHRYLYNSPYAGIHTTPVWSH